MPLPIGRIAIAAIAAEVLGILALVVLVMIFGPSGGFEAAQPFAERLGARSEGFVLCLAGGYWVARSAPAAPIQNGAAVGIAAAVLDIAIAVGLGGSLQLLLVESNVGRIVAGALGGWLASRLDSTSFPTVRYPFRR